MERPPIHVLLMGESGSGKDTFAATFPSPRLVWHLDGYGQEMPYKNNKLLTSAENQYGQAKEIGPLQNWVISGGLSVTYQDVIDAQGGFTRIEYYSSDNPTMPNVSSLLETRMSLFTAEQASWKTLICGSLSSAALESRLTEQFVLNPQFKDPRKWYGAATEYVERLIMMQKALHCNVVFICHVNREKDDVGGEFLYGPDLPGRLSYSAGRYFNEMYRVYIMRDAAGVPHRVVQTDGDGRFQVKTHINAPNPCWPSYESLWVNWR